MSNIVPPEKDAGRPRLFEASQTPPLDDENPWPGLKAFEEVDRSYFHGRDAETIELLRLVQRDRLTVLFARSGVGKTSLLRAGLFPKLRDNAGLPIYLRIDHDEAADHPVRQVLAAIFAEAARVGVEAPRAEDDDTLWQYFHRAGVAFWNGNTLVTPVLVVDQFEEIFTLGQESLERQRRSTELLTQLGDLIEGRAPVHVKADLDNAPERAQEFAFGQNICRLIFSLREEFLASLEELKNPIPSISNRMRLHPMRGDVAFQVLQQAAHLLDDTVAEAIVRFVAGDTRLTTSNGARLPGLERNLDELFVEPALLSLLCRELNQQRRARDERRISGALLQQSGTSILAGYYERCMRDRPALRVFVEDQLVTGSGYRRSAAEDDALKTPGVASNDIRSLVDARLLRREQRGGTHWLELTHDVLTNVVRRSRDERRHRQALRDARRRLWWTIAVFSAVVAVLGSFSGVLYYRYQMLRENVRSSYELGLQRFVQGRSREGATALAGALRAFPSAPFGESDAFLRTAAFTSLLYREWPRVTLAHANDVTSAAVSFDGARVVTGSADHAARLWDAHTGASIGQPMRHDGIVYAAAFSPDGTRLVTGSADGAVRIWDGHSGAAISTLSGHTAAVNAVTFSPVGTRIATASSDGTASLWDGSTGALIATLAGHGAALRAVSFNAAGTRVVTASDDRSARVWNGFTGAFVASMPHETKVRSARFSPDGRTIVTASDGTKASIWEAETGAHLADLEGHKGAVNAATFSPDGTWVATASADGTAGLFQVTNGVPRGRVEPLLHGSTVNSVEFNHDNTRLATTSEDGSARLWNTDRRAGTLGASVGLPLRHADAVWSATFSPDGNSVVTTSADNVAQVWETRPGSPRGRSLLHGSGVNAAAFSGDGRWIITASDDDTAGVWNAATGEPVASLPANAPVRAAALSADGTVAATASEDGKTQLWHLKDRTSAGRPPPLSYDAVVYAVAFSPDGALLATAAEDKTARLWNVHTREAGPPMRHEGIVRSVAFNNDGSRVVTASDDSTARVWDARSGAELGKPLEHKLAVRSAAFSTDGRHIVTASVDGVVRLWDADGVALVSAPARHGEAVNAAALSPDHALLVTAADDHTARLWDVRSGTAVGEPLQHDDRVLSAVFSSDGKQVLTASRDGMARQWDVSAAETISLDELAGFAESVALGRRRPALALSPAMSTLDEWFFANRTTRAIAPRSTMTVPEYEAARRKSTR